jgi:hypothetical protein
MVIECTGKTNEEEVKNFLEGAGAKEISTQIADDGWWFGTYDKEQKLYNDEQAIA